MYLKEREERKKEKGRKRSGSYEKGRRKKIGEGDGKYGESVQSIPAFGIAG